MPAAFLAAIAHLLALARGWWEDRRQAREEAAIRQAEADRRDVETLTEARRAEHAALDEVSAPADRKLAAGRLRDGRF